MQTRKPFLYGLGVGLIAAALLLQLGSIGESAATPSPETALEDLTFTELQSAAEGLGYKLYDANITLFTEEELEAMVKEAEETVKAEVSGQTVYAFTIPSGASLSTIGEMMFKMGFVESPSAFTSRVKELKLQTRIRADYYRFEAIPDLDELIEQITF